MRPDTFQDFAITTLGRHDTVAGALPLTAVGEQRYPYGVAIRLHDGTEYRWQITAESAPGDNYAAPEQLVDGDPAPTSPAPATAAPTASSAAGTSGTTGQAGTAGASGPYGLADADTLLAHILTHAGNPQLRTVHRHEHGLTIRCHSKATIHLRALPVPAAARR